MAPSVSPACSSALPRFSRALPNSGCRSTASRSVSIARALPPSASAPGPGCWRHPRATGRSADARSSASDSAVDVAPLLQRHAELQVATASFGSSGHAPEILTAPDGSPCCRRSGRGVARLGVARTQRHRLLERRARRINCFVHQSVAPRWYCASASPDPAPPPAGTPRWRRRSLPDPGRTRGDRARRPSWRRAPARRGSRPPPARS